MKITPRTLYVLTFSTFAGVTIFLRGALCSDVVRAEEFQPIKEAEMPRGFPKYTPVGQVEIKEYPAYRRATASGLSEFWKLFGHIQQNSIAMTAPVEMDYGDAQAKKPGERSMSFLYGSPELGKTGNQGDVTVNDVLAMQVVSIGCRGQRTAAAVATAQKELLRFLEENKTNFAIAGPMRVMGYNSPFVPAEKNFFEVQIPLRSVREGR